MKNLAAAVLILLMLATGVSVSVALFLVLPNAALPVVQNWVQLSLFTIGAVSTLALSYTLVSAGLLLTVFTREGFRPWFVPYAVSGLALALVSNAVVQGVPDYLSLMAPALVTVLKVCGILVPVACALGCLVGYPVARMSALVAEWAKSSNISSHVS